MAYYSPNSPAAPVFQVVKLISSPQRPMPPRQPPPQWISPVRGQLQMEVRAKDVPKVCDELGVLSLEDMECGSSPRRVSGGGGTTDFDGKNVTIGQRGQNGGGGTTTPPPPAPILPHWWNDDCKQQLDACAPTPSAFSTNGEEMDEYGTVLTYEHHQPITHQVAINDGYEVQLSIVQDGSVMCAEYALDPSASNAHLHDYVSPSSTSEQQLRVNVDQYPGFPSVLSSPSDDQPLSNAAGQPLEMLDDIHGDKWAPPSPGTPGTTVQLSYDELKTRVRHQLEYYFSRENLAADAYLRSQMDNDQFVKVATLASFNMVKRLTMDPNIILQALQESSVLQVNESGDKVRAIHKRSTLILREIPEGTKKEEVEELFSSSQCPKIVSSEYALNNIWYVNFETDEDAQKAFLYLRQKVQCFKGKPILARIKTAPIPRVPQNGSRPTPPNTLPLQNMSYPIAVSPSPNVVVTTGSSQQILLSPADSSIPNAPTPFSTASGPAAFPTTPGDSVNADTMMAVSASSPIYFYPAGHSPSLGGPSTTVIAAAAPPGSVLNSAASWPPTSPNTFDLGYILAMNGYQAQGAYRPALYVPGPAPVSPACHMGAAGNNTGPRFPVDRSIRKPRPGTYPSHHQPTDRTGAQSADSGRPPPPSTSSQPRYGHTSGGSNIRPTNGNSSNNNNNAGGSVGGGGYYADRKGSPYWKHDQSNIHYNHIRNRPNRYAFNGNYAGNGGGGMNNYGTSYERYPPRGGGDRGGGNGGGGRYGGRNDSWSTGGYQPKPIRKPPPPATTSTPSAASETTPPVTTVAAAASRPQEKKVEDSFDLQSSAFPPLPTCTPEDLEKEIADLSMDSQSGKKDIAESSSHPTHILQREHQYQQHNDQSNPTPAASTLIVKVQPRMKQADASTSSSATSPSAAMGTRPVDTAAAAVSKQQHSQSVSVNTEHPQKSEVPVVMTAAQKVARGGTGASIPIAVVQPNAQKQSKVATADKATATDLSPPMSRSAMAADDCSMSKTGSSDGKADAATKSPSDQGKKLSYADMAKHAAALRASGATNTSSVSSGSVPSSIAKTSATTAAIATNTSSGAIAATNATTATSTNNSKEQRTVRRQTLDKDRMTLGTLRDSELEDEEEDGDVSEYRTVKSKYGNSLRKQHARPYGRGPDGQEQFDGGVQVPPTY